MKVFLLLIIAMPTLSSDNIPKSTQQPYKTTSAHNRAKPLYFIVKKSGKFVGIVIPQNSPLLQKATK